MLTPFGSTKLELYHCFDESAVLIEPVGEHIYHGFIRRPVGNPSREIDLICLEIVDDLTEIRSSRVTATHKCQLTAMEVWIVKRHVSLEQSHEDEATPMSGKVEGSLH